MMVQKQANVTDLRVGARVRAQRLLLGMSQTDLGEAVGLTFQQIQKYEKGANRIGASRLQQIARVLKCPVSYFFEDEPVTSGSAVGASPGTAEVFSKFLANADGVKIARAWVKIPTGQQHALTKLVEQMADPRG